MPIQITQSGRQRAIPPSARDRHFQSGLVRPGTLAHVGASGRVVTRGPKTDPPILPDPVRVLRGSLMDLPSIMCTVSGSPPPSIRRAVWPDSAIGPECGAARNVARALPPLRSSRPVLFENQLAKVPAAANLVELGLRGRLRVEIAATEARFAERLVSPRNKGYDLKPQP